MAQKVVASDESAKSCEKAKRFGSFSEDRSQMAATQTSLLACHQILPKGFDHKDDVLSPDREFVLVGQFAQLPFKEFEFQGFLGRRREVSFGWRYDFSRRELQKAEEIPDFLLHLRVTATEFAGLDASRFQQVLVTEYSPGAGIGWDKDRPEFEHVIGVSLVSPCLFRLRRKRERIGTH